MSEQFKELLKTHDKISIITHRMPDADTLGTGLGIYEILKKAGKQVEICNAEKTLPIHLDFLPHFAKIKRQIDFDNSLIISCDSGSIDLLEFDLSLRTIVNIDHHKSNTCYGTLNLIDASCVSASQVAYNIFKDDYGFTKSSATCFYVAMVSDTQSFSTLNMRSEVFDVASSLLAYGINLEEVNHNLNQRKSLSSLRLLSATLDTLELSEEASLATLIVSQENMKKSGASNMDTIGIIDHAISLVTVQIAILLIEFEDSIKVSFRSKKADVSSLATGFGGGGHLLSSGFKSECTNALELISIIKKEIKKIGLLNET